jgi:hypothetical protein
MLVFAGKRGGIVLASVVFFKNIQPISVGV